MYTVEQLKAICKQQKMTYQELSDKSGIPLGTIRSIFSFRYKSPRLDTINAIEKALGINSQEPQRLLTPDEQKLVDIIVNLRPEEVKLLSDYVDFIVERRKK